MDVQGCSFKLAHNTTEISKHIVASLALQIGQSILCAEDDVCKPVGIGMPPWRSPLGKGRPDYTPTSRESFAPKRGSSFAESLVHGLRPWLHSFAAARLTWMRQLCLTPLWERRGREAHRVRVEVATNPEVFCIRAQLWQNLTHNVERASLCACPEFQVDQTSLRLEVQ